jgi:aspartate kinase
MSASQNLVVMKFGGTSVGSVDGLSKLVEITKQTQKDWKNVVMVASAFAGNTNLLLKIADLAQKSDFLVVETAIDEMTVRNEKFMLDMVRDASKREQANLRLRPLLDELKLVCQAVSVIKEISPRVSDLIVSFGERMSVIVIETILRDAGVRAEAVEATELIVTDDVHQNASPLLAETIEKTNRRLGALLEKGIVPVVTGFIAASRSGQLTTLGRGGSDYSAALLGVALEADEVWIWTDVNGVMTADPRLVPEAKTIPQISYQEVSELAYFGAKVLHPKTIRPVIEAGIKLKVLNTFEPDNPGTELTAGTSENYDEEPIIKSVTAIRGVQLVTVEGSGMLGVPGQAARFLSAVSKTGATVPFITEASSEQSITFAVPVAYTECVVAALEDLLAEQIEARKIDQVKTTDEVVIVTVVCPNMQHRLGVAGKIFSALGDAEINVLAISHGSCEVSLSLIVGVEAMQPTVQVLHSLTAL